MNKISSFDVVSPFLHIALSDTVQDKINNVT